MGVCVFVRASQWVSVCSCFSGCLCVGARASQWVSACWCVRHSGCLRVRACVTVSPCVTTLSGNVLFNMIAILSFSLLGGSVKLVCTSECQGLCNLSHKKLRGEVVAASLPGRFCSD